MPTTALEWCTNHQTWEGKRLSGVGEQKGTCQAEEGSQCPGCSILHPSKGQTRRVSSGLHQEHPPPILGLGPGQLNSHEGKPVTEQLFQKLLKTLFLTSHAAAEVPVCSQTPRAHGGVGSQPSVPDRCSLVCWVTLRTHREGRDRPGSPRWYQWQDPKAGTPRQERDGQCVGQGLPGNVLVTSVCTLRCPRATSTVSNTSAVQQQSFQHIFLPDSISQGCSNGKEMRFPTIASHQGWPGWGHSQRRERTL